MFHRYLQMLNKKTCIITIINMVDIHGRLKTRGETRCLGEVSISCLASHTCIECLYHRKFVYIKGRHWMRTETEQRNCHVLYCFIPWTRKQFSSLSALYQEQDTSSYIQQQPPFGNRKESNTQPQKRGRGLQNQQEHHIILTKYEAVHLTAVSENNSSLGMLIIWTIPNSLY